MEYEMNSEVLFKHIETLNSQNKGECPQRFIAVGSVKRNKAKSLHAILSVQAVESDGSAVVSILPGSTVLGHQKIGESLEQCKNRDNLRFSLLKDSRNRKYIEYKTSKVVYTHSSQDEDARKQAYKQLLLNVQGALELQQNQIQKILIYYYVSFIDLVDKVMYLRKVEYNDILQGKQSTIRYQADMKREDPSADDLVYEFKQTDECDSTSDSVEKILNNLESYLDKQSDGSSDSNCDDIDKQQTDLNNSGQDIEYSYTQANIQELKPPIQIQHWMNENKLFIELNEHCNFDISIEKDSNIDSNTVAFQYGKDKLIIHVSPECTGVRIIGK